MKFFISFLMILNMALTQDNPGTMEDFLVRKIDASSVEKLECFLYKDSFKAMLDEKPLSQFHDKWIYESDAWTEFSKCITSKSLALMLGKDLIIDSRIPHNIQFLISDLVEDDYFSATINELSCKLVKRNKNSARAELYAQDRLIFSYSDKKVVLPSDQNSAIIEFSSCQEKIAQAKTDGSTQVNIYPLRKSMEDVLQPQL